MKTKIICILVMTLLITTAMSAMGMTSQKSANEELISHQSSSARAPYVPIEFEKMTKPSVVGGTPFYGYICYDPLGTLTLGPCSFMPTTPGTLNLLAPSTSTDFLSGGTWANGVWYGCEYSSGAGNPYIWTINHNTGIMTLIGSYDTGGTGLCLHGLAYDPTANKLYGCSDTDLYAISMTTGASSLVGPFGIGGEIMIGIAFDGSGNLYGVDIVSDSLYAINPVSGSAGLVGSLGISLNFAQDMAFDWDTGILYLSAFTNVPFEGALYTCNTGTGATTKIGSFENTAEITCFAIPVNNPPNPPQISGPPSGKKNTVLSYMFTSADPDGDQVSYYVDWGDGTPPVWSPFIASGSPFPDSHSWSDDGTYVISAKAKDTSGDESTTTTFTITIPRNKVIKNPFLNFLQSHPNLFPILQKLFQQLGL